MQDFQEKVAVVTGTANPRGIGMATEEVAHTAIVAIRNDSFWARPSADDDNHRETVEWEAKIYRTRAETLIARTAPDPYLWGPASNLLAP